MSGHPAQHRPYQGYPYVNPGVTDAPSITPEAASKWANLPRRQIHIPERRPTAALNAGEGRSGVTQDNVPMKKEPSEIPVVYIDIPEAGGSGMVASRTDSETEEPAFVQETIMYDPFEDRRINMSRGDSMKSGSESSSIASVHLPQQRPTPPNTLNLASPSTASTSTGEATSSATQASYLTKESLVYGSHPDDSFPLSPIPISEMPQPPPAYTEYDIGYVNRQPTREEPRTQVILPPVTNLSSPIEVTGGGRKLLRCQHCGVNVVTLIIRESGYATHIAAIICFIFCLPLIFCVYLSSFFKYKNHYCPNCNKKIGYEYPIFDSEITFV